MRCCRPATAPPQKKAVSPAVNQLINAATHASVHCPLRSSPPDHTPPNATQQQHVHVVGATIKSCTYTYTYVYYICTLYTYVIALHWLMIYFILYIKRRAEKRREEKREGVCFFVRPYEEVRTHGFPTFGHSPALSHVAR